jgi:sn-glycerol 3-phosphate transport system substrate-binding protein
LVDSGKVVISLWVPDYPFMTFHQERVRQLARNFSQAHPRYHVEVRGLEYLTLSDEIHAAALAGRPPTIAQYFYASTQEALDTRTGTGAPAFTSVEKAIGGRMEILGEPVVFDDIVAAARDYYRVDGAAASMPLLTSTTLLYTNVTMLEAAGITEIPQTWAEIDAACAAIARLRGGPSHAVTWPNQGWFFQQSVAQQGGLLAGNDNGRSARAETVDLASDEMIAYAQWWQKLHRDGHYLYLSNGVEVDWDANFAAFADQRVAFTLTSSVEAARMIQAGRDGGFTARASRMPYNGDVPYAGNMIGGDSLWLSDGLDQETQDGALAFMQYLCNPGDAARRHKETGFIPISSASIRLLEEEGWFARNPDLLVAIDQIEATSGSLAARGALLGEFAAIQECMTRAMHDVLVSRAGPRARFARATAEAQRILDSYTAYCRGERPRGPIRVN